MPEWVRTRDDESQTLAEMRAQLRSEKESAALLSETLADIELAMEDVGWRKLATGTGEYDFSTDGRKRHADQCTMGLTLNPLIIRGMMLRRVYIWGQGVGISVDDDESGQDVNGVVQKFLEDERNVVTFSGAAAREEIENLLGTTGEVFYCLPTNIVTGEVVVRRIEADEVVDIITDPDDRFTPWYYKRVWQQRTLGADGKLGEWQERKAWYPALGYHPTGADKLDNIGGDAVVWDQPVRHRAVNKHGRQTRGVGDIYPAMPWAKSTKEVLEAWIILFKSLARYAYQVKGDKPQQIAAAIRASAAPNTGVSGGAGATIATGSGGTMETVSKTAGLLDIQGAKWPAMFIASAFGVPVTMLLSDPGQTGARAVAETLDQPTELMARSRQSLHAEDIEAICRYVVRCNIIATLGNTLKGDVLSVGGREVVTLRPKDSRRKGVDNPVRVKVDWPDFDSTSVLEKVQAIVQAGSTGVVPAETTLAEILAALKVPDADKILDANTDAEGRFIPLPDRTPATPAADPNAKPDPGAQLAQGSKSGATN